MNKVTATTSWTRHRKAIIYSSLPYSPLISPWMLRTREMLKTSLRIKEIQGAKWLAVKTHQNGRVNNWAAAYNDNKINLFRNIAVPQHIIKLNIDKPIMAPKTGHQFLAKEYWASASVFNKLRHRAAKVIITLIWNGMYCRLKVFQSIIQIRNSLPRGHKPCKRIRKRLTHLH